LDTGRAREIFTHIAGAMAYVEVENGDGDRGIGSAFHVGSGVFVTARHVVEGNTVCEVRMTEPTYIELHGEQAASAQVFVHREGRAIPSHHVDNGVLQISGGPFFHRDARVDVAAFQVDAIDPATPVVQLGSHLDDMIGQSDFILSEAVILGYPPIPMSAHPVLVGARAEVNAQVDLYDTPHVHFILSTTARGGFSGGLAYSEWGFVLGLVTRSLIESGGATEAGYMAVLGIEPIYECLATHRILPDLQAEDWDDLWGSTTLDFYSPRLDPSDPQGARITASISIFNDGKRAYVEARCDDLNTLNVITSTLLTAPGSTRDVAELPHQACQVGFRYEQSGMDELLKEAAQLAARVLHDAGYAAFKHDDLATRLISPDI
jgi:hypothetical protein